MRAAATLHSEDSDFGQAGHALPRGLLGRRPSVRLQATLAGQAASITVDEIRERFFQYWTNVDADLGAALREAFNREDAAA